MPLRINTLRQNNERREVVFRLREKSQLEIFMRSRPALFIIYIFAIVVGFFTLLLALPIATASGERPELSLAFFTTTSAISGTGLIAVPTGTYWSHFGKFIIMVTIQVGGLGIMSLASILSMMISKHFGLTTKILASQDVKENRFGEIGPLLKVIGATVIACELFVTACLIPQFIEIHENFGEALWHSMFFAVSAFNNAGFDNSVDGISTWGASWGVAIPIIIGITMGAIGFPVIRNIGQVVRHGKLSLLNLNSRLVLIMFVTMDVIILLWFYTVEWNNQWLFSANIYNNPSSHASGLALGALTVQSSGFGILDSSAISQPTLVLLDIWMFIGGAPASTCAGIKVTTVAVLVLAVIAEFRGREDIQVFNKRLTPNALKVATTIFICGIVTVVVFTILLSLLHPNAPIDVVIFDVISAFANCGMSLGLSAYLSQVGLILLGILMFLGRLGIMTVAVALIRQERINLIRYPQENVLLG